MFYMIYKTTNMVNSKWYLGYHSTNDLFDEYLGSGYLLKRAIKKYGKDSFSKEILYLFPTKKEALKKEFELVNESIVNNPNSYNLMRGGKGGWDYINNVLKNDSNYKKAKSKKQSESIKKLYREGKIKGWVYHGGFEGKKHTIKSKKLISDNNGMLLSEKETKNRKKDYMSIDKKRGYISKLAKKWNVSHTQVRRFIKNMALSSKLE